MLIRVCSRNHRVLDLAEMRGPRIESKQTGWGMGAACLCPSQRTKAASKVWEEELDQDSWEKEGGWRDVSLSHRAEYLQYWEQ